MPEQVPSEQQPDALKHEHASESKQGVQCACCAGDAPSPDDMQAVQEDAATRSLSRALMMSFGLLKLVMAVIVLFFLFDCVTFVEEGSVGMKRRFGRFVTEPGDPDRIHLYKAGELVFVLPQPLEELVSIPSVSGQDRAIFLETEFWPKEKRARTPGREAGADELENRENLSPAEDGYNLTSSGDIKHGTINIIHSKWELRYRIRDPQKYILATADVPKPGILEQLEKARFEGGMQKEDLRPEHMLEPEDVLRAVACSVISRRLAGASVEDVIKSKKAGRILDDIKSRLQAEMNGEIGDRDYGIEVLAVNALSTPVPGKAKPAFDEVTSALTQRKTKIENAKSERETIMQEARAQAEKITNEARVYKQRVVAKARADAEYLTSLLLVSPLTEEADILDWVSLAKALTDAKRSLACTRVWERLPKKAQATVMTIAKTGRALPEQKTLFVDGLRVVQTQSDLYDAAACKGLVLRPEVQMLLKRNQNLVAQGEPDGLFLKENQMLGRLLLEAVFPQQMRRLSSMYRRPEDLDIFLSQNHLKVIREVLEKTQVHLVQPGARSVLISSPRPAMPQTEMK